jgi:NAD(P)-dependent dehydrogenase (short-subunit alcohol dehydrogenase family)
MMDISLKGKVALVTGGGAGIGRGIVDAFHELGAQVAVAEIDDAKIETLKSYLGDTGLVAKCDVQKADQVAALMKQIDQKYGKLDILVNNVGHHLYSYKPLRDITDEEVDALYDINLRHLFIVTRAATPLIQRTGKGGSIINISSIEGFRGCTYNVAYTTFKHAVTGFTEAMALELSADQIRVNTIAPETTDSEQVPIDKMVKPQYRGREARSLPLGRFGKPSDHAGAAVYLATDLSSWVTGTTIHVDGGGLAAAGFQRMPDGSFTICPIVVDSAM